MPTENNTHTDNNSNNWQFVDQRTHMNQSNKSSNKHNDVPLRNRFNGLFNEEMYSREKINHSNDQGIDFNISNNASSSFNINKRPNIVVNKHHDNDILPKSRDNVVKRTLPGNSSYANISKSGKKICLLGSSIIQRIKIHNFNNALNDGKAIKRSHSGCTTSRMKYYVKEVLEEEHPDTIILQIGGNDLSNRNSTEQFIVSEIINIVNLCRNGGVNEIIVSSITPRPEHQTKLDEVNRLLKANAYAHNYVFSDNSNIHPSDLWKDNVHLNNRGILLLTNNYLDILHNRPNFYDFY